MTQGGDSQPVSLATWLWPSRKKAPYSFTHDPRKCRNSRLLHPQSGCSCPRGGCSCPVSPSWALGLLLAQPLLGDSGAETPKTLLWAVGPVTEVTPEPR